MRHAVRVMAAAALVAGALTAVACFPDYAIGGDAAAPADGSVFEGSAADQTSGADAASDGGADGATGADAGPDVGADAGPCFAAFPGTGILDPFDANGPLDDTRWTVEAPGAYAVQNHEVVATDAGLLRPGAITWDTPGGAMQEVYVTIDQLNEDGGNGDEEIELLLKAVVPGTEADAIYVDYTDETGPLGLSWGYSTSDQDFHGLGTSALSLSPGDQFGARACPDGIVNVYKNGALVQSFSASAYPGATSGGYFSFFSSAVELPLAISHFGGG